MSGKSVCILLAVGAAAVVVPWSVGQETRQAISRPATLAGQRVFIDLSSPVVQALAGSTVAVTLFGEPKAGCLWQFGYRDTVIKQGRLQLDNEGTGRFKLVLPDVRSRAECTLMIVTDEKKVSRRLTVFPSARLAGNAKLIKTCRFAVIDGSGRVQKTLKAEKVVFEDLKTRLLQDSFDGGAVILSGFEKNELLGDTCRRFQGRIEKGMFVVIVNPPAKWTGWGMSLRHLSRPLKSAVSFTGDFGQAVKSADLGSGPWRSVLHSKGRWKMSAWIKEVSKDDKGKPRLVRHPLISVRRIGRGRVIIVLLPQMADTLNDAIGRAVLDELVLWVLKKRFDGHSRKEQKS